MFSNNGLRLRVAAQYVLLFLDTAQQFQPVLNFTKLHALNVAACSYAFLPTLTNNLTV